MTLKQLENPYRSKKLKLHSCRGRVGQKKGKARWIQYLTLMLLLLLLLLLVLLHLLLYL